MPEAAGHRVLVVQLLMEVETLQITVLQTPEVVGVVGVAKALALAQQVHIKAAMAALELL